MLRSTIRTTGGLGLAERRLQMQWAEFEVPSYNWMELGQYTGDGTTSHAITGVDFQSLAVFVIRPSTGILNWTSSVMAANQTLNVLAAGFTQSNKIKSIDAGGFTVGSHTDVNEPSITYYYVCFRNLSSRITTGTFTGDGTNGRAIAAAGFTSEFVLLQDASTVLNETGRWRVSTGQPGDSTFPFNTANGASAGFIQSISATGFTVGTSANNNNDPYFYLCFAPMTGEVLSGTYQGDNSVGRNIASGFNPQFAFVKRDAATNPALLAFRHVKEVGDDSIILSAGNSGNRIQSFSTPANGFQVGSDYSVNGNDGVNATYRWLTLAGGKVI